MEKEAGFAWNQEHWDALLSYLENEGSVFRRPRYKREIVDTEKVAGFIVEMFDLSFSEALLKMIDHLGLSDVEVYKAAKVDRRVFSKLRSSASYQPSRNTAIRLCLALETTPAEAGLLLGKAGYCLSHAKKEDLVVLFCLENHIYDVNAVNEALHRLGLEELLS